MKSIKSVTIKQESYVSKTRNALQKATNMFRNSFRRCKIMKIEEKIKAPVDNSVEDLQSARDSTYFSLTQSCIEDSDSDILEETNTANNSFDNFTRLFVGPTIRTFLPLFSYKTD